MRYPYPAEAEMHIRSELSRRGILFKEKKNDFVIECPFCPDVSKFKLEIRKDGKKVHCWRCNYSGSWSKISKDLGMADFNKKTHGFSTQAAKLNMFDKLAEQLSVVEQKHNLELPLEELDIWNGVNNDGKSWRGLTVEFLRSLPSYAWHQITKYHQRVERILFPFYQFGDLLGYSGRRLDASDVMRYDNAEFASALHIFYPYDYVVANFKTDRIVLVEGQVDALWLLQNGIPTLSILGTPNWSSFKRDLLVGMGINKVFICMDGDAAGKKASTAIYGDLIPIMDRVSIMELPESVDPATLTTDQLKWLSVSLKKL